MSVVRRGVRSLLFHAGRSADRAASLSHYLGAGTLRLAEMRDGIRQTWNDFHDAHPAVDAGFLPWEEEIIERFVPAGSRVLLIGCGSGRDLVAFAERGCEVTGVDPASSALHAARRTLNERRLTAALVEGFFEEATIAGAFDVVMFSFYCYAFVPGANRRIAVLRKAAALLSPRGLIVVSHASTKVRPRRLAITMARLVGALCRLDWRLEPGDLVWDTRHGLPAYSYAHAFDAGELEREAAAAGLSPAFHRATSENVTFVLKRT